MQVMSACKIMVCKLLNSDFVLCIKMIIFVRNNKKCHYEKVLPSWYLSDTITGQM
jgi:hypothetical protein